MFSCARLRVSVLRRNSQRQAHLRKVCPTLPRKRAHWRRSLRVRTSGAMAKTGPHHARLCTSTAAKTRSLAQEPACKDLRPKWPKTSHLQILPRKCVPWRRSLRVRTLGAMVKTRPSHPMPLTLRLLTAPVHALTKSTAS